MYTLDFEPNPACSYKHDYEAIFRAIASGELDARPAFRQLIVEDLFFTTFFIVRPYVDPYKTNCNHPFVVNMCKIVENGPKTMTLDVWAREHFKSSIMTIGETIQYIVKNPEHANAIFSFSRPAAKRFLFSLRTILETNELLKWAYSDVLWEEPRKQAPIWSMDDGLILKRRSNRKEPTIGAYGLTDAMPVGGHYERRIYDDIVTEDCADSLLIMEDVKKKFDSSDNLGVAEGGIVKVIGTYYHHNDPLVYIKEKKDIETGAPLYRTRVVPATIDGTASGAPVLLPQERLNILKVSKTFNAQQLCNPTPKGTEKLNSDFLIPIEKKFIPKNVIRLLIIDQAGDLVTNLKQDNSDSWAIGVVAVSLDDDSADTSSIFIEDMLVSPMGASEAIDAAVKMYIRNGAIDKVCVERVGISTTHIHITEALTRRGRHVDEEDGSLVLLRPAGRNKVRFIESSLAWPLNNSKIHYSKSIPTSQIEILKAEMDKFPFWHDDALNMLAYTYDIIKDETLGGGDAFTKDIQYRQTGVV